MNETEKRLRIYRAISANPQWVEILQDALAIQERGEAEKAEGSFWLGFQWFNVHASSPTLKKMVTTKLLDVTFSSNKSTHYRVADPALVKEAIQAILEPASEPQHETPADLFDSIVGYSYVKTIVRYALEADKHIKHIIVITQPCLSPSALMSIVS